MIKLVVGAVAGLLIFGAVAAGCGGSDGETTPTKAQFLQKGNAICAKAEGEKLAIAQKAISALPKNATLSVSAQVKLIPSGIVKPYTKAADEIEELGAPEGEEDQVEKILAAMRKSLKEAEENPKAVATGGGTFAEVDELTTKYGLTKCLL